MLTICACVHARFMPASTLYKQDTYSHLQDLIVYTRILRSDGFDHPSSWHSYYAQQTDTVVDSTQAVFPHYTHIAFIPTLSFLLILLHSVSAAGVPTYSATKCCHAGFSLRFVQWKLLLLLFFAIPAVRK